MRFFSIFLTFPPKKALIAIVKPFQMCLNCVQKNEQIFLGIKENQ